VALLAALALAAPARAQGRVASLNLTADEILVEILPPERLVGVTRFADEQGTSNVVGRVPASAARFPKADIERLVALSPDLVVVSEYTDADFLRQLEKTGLRWHRIEGLATLPGIRKAILDLGRAVGEGAAAERMAKAFDAKLADLGRRLAGVKQPRLLYWSSGMTAGADTAIGSLIECAGARNVGRELGVTGIAEPGGERAFVADPDAILVGTWPRAVETVREEPLLGRSRAAREGRIVVLPTSLLVALSQFSADACVELAARLHPDRVAPKRP
jgi:iron complex transport system substrate-binding protein